MSFAKNNSEGLPGLGFGSLVSGRFSINKEVQKGLLGDKFLLNTIIICFLLLFSQVGLLFFVLGKLPPEIPLYYSRPWGDDVMAPKISLWLIPIICFIFLVINFIFAKYFLGDNKFLIRSLAGINCVLSFSSFWVVFKITTLLI